MGVGLLKWLALRYDCTYSAYLYLHFVGHNFEDICIKKMGGAMSVEVPGGGTEGYHVLRVSTNVLHCIASIAVPIPYMITIWKLITVI